MEKRRCLVIMPFGQKSLPGNPEAKHDFDYVYEHIIEPAIISADMQPIRGDKLLETGLIHQQLFESLRDSEFVIADLSFHNPNVFYELGVRHVMAERGTLLLRREGEPLPFNLDICRALTYEFDGTEFSSEETVCLREKITDILRGAHKYLPDSPVRCFLDNPIQTSRNETDSTGGGLQDLLPISDPHQKYQKYVASLWRMEDKQYGERDLDQLVSEHSKSAFGVAALCYYFQSLPELPSQAVKLLQPLAVHQKHRLARELYDLLGQKDALTPKVQAKLASTISEADPSPGGASLAAKIAAEAIERAKGRLKQAPEDSELLAEVGYCSAYLGGLMCWQWNIEPTSDQRSSLLASALHHFAEAIRYFGLAAPEHRSGRLLVRAHVDSLLLLRARDEGEPEGSEEHGNIVMEMRPFRTDVPMPASWLGWWQILIQADRCPGSKEDRDAIAARLEKQIAADKLLIGAGWPDIGKRQYKILIRYLESRLASHFNNKDLINLVQRRLQQEAR